MLRQAQQNGAAPYDLARLAQRVAASYLAEGEDQAAYDTAMGIQDVRLRQSVPVLDWYAGFAAYRMGNYADAAARLEILASVGSVPNYLRSQAAFWAARGASALRRSAARHHAAERGGARGADLLRRARRTHARPGHPDRLRRSGADRARLRRDHGGAGGAPRRRAHPGRRGTRQRPRRAQPRLRQQRRQPRHGLCRARPPHERAEHRAGASETAASRGVLLTGLFPVPGYKPDGGYTIDPSLVLAFTRAESRFVADAVSPGRGRAA
ncbi:MAG: hypothetical protein WDM81_17490 [Rhizomicrobium sp.]